MKDMLKRDNFMFIENNSNAAEVKWGQEQNIC